MAILVTGAAGFIGAATAEALLRAGEQVIGIDNFSPYYDPALKHARVAQLTTRHGAALRFVPVDFSDAAALAEALDGAAIDRIVHLGAQAGVRYSINHPQAYIQSNLVGHANLLELARARQVAHFVYASSSSVYGANRSLPFRVEDRVDHPISLYAATKKSAELMSEAYASLYRVPTTGLRFFTVYGPWGRPDMALWTFTAALFAGDPLPLYNGGEMRRDFTFIDDIVSGVVASLGRPPADDGEVKPGGSQAPHALYNLGNSRSEDLMRVVEVLERATGAKALLSPQPMQPGDVKDTFADIGAATRDLHYEPRTTIDDGIPRFVAWYRDYHHI